MTLAGGAVRRSKADSLVADMETEMAEAEVTACVPDPPEAVPCPPSVDDRGEMVDEDDL